MYRIFNDDCVKLMSEWVNKNEEREREINII